MSDEGQQYASKAGSKSMAEQLADLDEQLSALSGFKKEPDPNVNVGLNRPLFNGRKPLYVLQSERLEHRAIAELKAQGMTDKEIHNNTGFSLAMIGYVKKQSWFEQAVLDEIARRSSKVQEYLEEQAMKSLETLVQGRDEANAWKDRINAANSLLDRRFGKPNQPISVVKAPAGDMSDTSIKQELESIIEQETRTSTGTSQSA